MSKIWKVAWYEYTRHVFRKRFIIAVLSIPIIIGLSLGISILSTLAQTDIRPVGYVDLAGVITQDYTPSESQSIYSKSVEMIRYSSQAQAQSALDAGEIQGFFLLPADYYSTSTVQLISKTEVESSARYQFEAYLKQNLLTGQSPQIVSRILDGSHLTVATPDESRSMGEDDIVNIMVPIFTGLLFMMTIFTSGGYLMQAVVEEKENRTMEILVTSLSPNQLMAGKILGNLSAGLTQLTAWLAFIALGIAAGSPYVDWLSRIQVSADLVWIVLGTTLPTFVIIAALMATVGATVTEAREAQQISGIFTLPVVAPYWLTNQIINNPNGNLAVGLSYFPLTSSVTMTLRSAFTPIPAGQIVSVVLILVATAAATIWLSGRAFRLGMLRYGKRVSLKELLGNFTRIQE